MRSHTLLEGTSASAWCVAVVLAASACGGSSDEGSPSAAMCDPSGTWRYVHTRTQSSGGICADPLFSQSSGRVDISGLGDTLTLVDTDDDTGETHTYGAAFDRQACRLTLNTIIAVLFPLDDGSVATVSGSDQTTITFEGNAAATTGTVSLSADVPLPGVPCTFAYAGSGTRHSSSTEPPPEQPPQQPPQQPPPQPPPQQPPPQQPPPQQPPPQQPPPPPPEERQPMADGVWHVRYSYYANDGGACGDDYRRYFEHDVEPRLTGYDDCSRRHSERRVAGGWELVVVDECRFTQGTLTLFLEDGATVATGTLRLVQYGDLDRTPAAVCTLYYDTTATRP